MPRLLKALLPLCFLFAFKPAFSCVHFYYLFPNSQPLYRFQQFFLTDSNQRNPSSTNQYFETDSNQQIPSSLYQYFLTDNNWASLGDAASADKMSDFRLLSDKTLLDLKTGQFLEALTIFDSLYRLYSTEYGIITNLAFVHELNGHYAVAAELLRKAIALQPQQHEGSEQLHLLILEQQSRSKPDYAGIVNLQIGDFSSWITDKKYQFPHAADSLKRELANILISRMFFIPPPSPVTAQLLVDFGDLVSKGDTMLKAIPYYELAARYNSSLDSLTNNRKNTVLNEKKIVKESFQWATVVWAIPLIAFAFIFIAWLKSRRNNRGN